MFQAYETDIVLNLPVTVSLARLQAQIPGICLAKNAKYHHELSFIQSQQPPALFTNSLQTTIYSQWSETWHTDIPHVLYALLRKHWLEHNYYPVHSVSAGKNLIVGHSGTGKTTLALEMLKENQSVFSFDKTLLRYKNKMLMPVAGVQVISVRKHMVVPESFIHINESKDRIIYEAPSVEPQAVKVIYLLNINDKPLRVERLSEISALHTLYPYFLDKTHEDILLNAAEIVWQGNISKKVNKKVVKKLQNIVKHIPVFTLWGSVEECVQYLKSSQ